MSRRAKRMLPLAGVLLLLASLGCADVERRVDLLDAYSEIGAAIDFKAAECGNRPAYPLIIPGRPSEYGTRLCSLTIVRQTCPFNDYPLFCLEIYTEECDACDLPLIGP